MACFFEALGDQRAHSTATHHNKVHTSNLHPYFPFLHTTLAAWLI
jgi:hypothetical protein